MQTLGIVILAVAIGLSCPVASYSGEPALADTVTTRVADIEVKAASLPWGEAVLTDADLRARPGANLAEDLEHLPGVALVRRAASAGEPVIRGLGWERVQTLLGAVPLYGSCPGRMDPPATYLTSLSADQVTIRRQGGAWHGPGGTGGAIVANPDYEPVAGTATGVTPWLGAGYGSARDGVRIEGGLLGSSDALDYKFGLGHRQDDDYTAPDGTVVPAGQTTTSAAGAVGWRPRADQRLWYAATYARETDIDFPAMPMDNIATDFWVHNAGWRLRRPSGSLRRVELTAGVSVVDHFMDNSQKPNRTVMAAATDADTRSTALRAHCDLALAPDWGLATGIDLTRLTRDALRTRVMAADGRTFRDRLWPDAVQMSVGGFADLSHELSRTVALTVTGRADVIDSEARAADSASLGGRTVREQYEIFYGPGATATDRTETLGQCGLGLRGEMQPGRQWFVRTGLSTRSAGITERYYAFGPAPGGFQIGNPTLAAEKKWEAELGLTLTAERLTVSLSGYHAAVNDFILPTIVGRRDVNGDTIADNIKGFTNVDATLSGGELGLEYRPQAALTLPVTVSYVRGRNTSDGRDLPEIPPLFGTAEVRWRAHAESATWLRFGGVLAADQDRIDTLFGENRTGGYAVWHAGIQSRPLGSWRVNLVLENLFDRLYHDHLTREAVLPVGDLVAGQEISAPGRGLTINVRKEF